MFVIQTQRLLDHVWWEDIKGVSASAREEIWSKPFSFIATFKIILSFPMFIRNNLHTTMKRPEKKSFLSPKDGNLSFHDNLWDGKWTTPHFGNSWQGRYSKQVLSTVENKKHATFVIRGLHNKLTRRSQENKKGQKHLVCYWSNKWYIWSTSFKAEECCQKYSLLTWKFMVFLSNSGNQSVFPSTRKSILSALECGPVCAFSLESKCTGKHWSK